MVYSTKPVTLCVRPRCRKSKRTKNPIISKAQQTMRRIGLQLVREKQREVLEEKASGGGTTLESGKDKDLLNLLIKANMDKDLPAEQQLSVDQILNQIPTFLVAGEQGPAAQILYWPLPSRGQKNKRARNDLI
jgi:cytochrome P450